MNSILSSSVVSENIYLPHCTVGCKAERAYQANKYKFQQLQSSSSCNHACKCIKFYHITNQLILVFSASIDMTSLKVLICHFQTKTMTMAKN